MKNIIIAAIAEAISMLIGKSDAQVKAFGKAHGVWLQANVTDKIPSGETFESIAEKVSGAYLAGVREGLNIKE